MFARSIALACTLLAATVHAASPTLPPELESKLRARYEEVATAHGNLFERLDPNDLRHPFEKKVLAGLYKDQRVQDLLPEAQKIAAEINDSYHKQHLLTGVLCSPTQFPEIHALASEIADALQMKKGFKIYVMNSPSINAYTWSIDENNYGVALFSGLLRSMTTEQLRAILGHEMGHVKSRHILTSVIIELYAQKHEALPGVFALKKDGSTDTGPKKHQRVAGASFGFTDIPANLAGDLSRRLGLNNVKPLDITDQEYKNLTLLDQAAEYSSDRTGAVASGNRLDTLMGMVKLASGHTGELGGFDMDAYLAQIESVLATMSHAELENMMASEGSHAFTLMRVGELDNYFKSPDFVEARTRKASVFRDIMSAEFQVSGVMLETITMRDKFFASPAAQELNALERRLKEKQFADIIAPRQQVDDVLQPLILDTIYELGLANDNAAFVIYEQYARLRKSGAAIKPLSVKLIERIKFELTNDSLPPAQVAELERKLKIAKEIRDLKPNKPANGAAVTGEDEDEDDDAV